MASDKRNPDDLLGDLESIKDLLSEDDTSNAGAEDEGERADAPAAAEDSEPEDEDDTVALDESLIPEPDQDLDVPVLDDVVDGAIEVDEGPLIRRDELDTEGPRLLRDDTIRALMGDEWKVSSDRILTEARESIRAAKDKWSPQQTDELVEALKVRIDATVDEWVSSLIAERIHELRDELISVMHTATTEFISNELKGSDGQ